MTLFIKHIYNHLSLLALTVVMLIAGSVPASAFDTAIYAQKSQLAEGKWVKVSVASTGLYLITNAQLRSWGFNDPARVRVHGYGGQRISDHLTLANYIDDLPMVQSELTSRGIVFYAQGVETWTRADGRYIHSLNPFTTRGYYFLTEAADTPLREIPTQGTPSASNPATTFTDYLYHEKDIYKIGETGHQLLGEDFKWNNTQSFTFQLPDIDKSVDMSIMCSVVTKAKQQSLMTFTANGKTLAKSNNDYINATNYDSNHNLGQQGTTVKTFKVNDDKLLLQVHLGTTGTVSEANLDYISINYERHLRLKNGSLLYRLDNPEGALQGAGAGTRVWDVTDPLNISRLNTAIKDGAAVWTNSDGGLRAYAAWNEEATLPSPDFAGNVSNQNLHDPAETPAMVIFSRGEWRAQAERLANLHRNSADSLSVVVIDQDNVYNEFGSGAPDVNTFRRYLKMVYDRGKAAGRPLQYALFMGKPTFDNRRISAQTQALTYPTMPTWQSDFSLNDNSSFTTDDIFSFLEDNSGLHLGGDYLSIAVGRIPVRNNEDAKNAVDKIYDYVNKSRHNTWRNQIMLVADDKNNGEFMLQSEEFIDQLNANPDGDQFMITKVYIDAFRMANNTMPEARQRMFSRLDEGTLWWCYNGHANPTSWTAEGLFTFNDMNNLYLKNYPVLFAVTCEFLNWDSTALSGAEILFHNRQGGIVGAITAVRPVYVTDNGEFYNHMATFMSKRDDNGRLLTLGEVYRNAKNNFRNASGTTRPNNNKLRFVLMGDPALRLVASDNKVIIEKINGLDIDDPENQIIIKAREEVMIEGYVADPMGRPIDNFDGALNLDLYDAEYSTTSHGYVTAGLSENERGDGLQLTFEETGVKLYSGRDSINAGRFKMRVAMPEAITGNFRPATINMYAAGHDGRGAMGVSRNFYVYGYDEKATADTIPPAIETIYLNHPTFADGAKVNPEPTLFATVSDNLGINLSSLGIGHQMSILVDGNINYTDVAKHYTPDMGSLGGYIAYPVPALAAGEHTLRLRVWDTSGNCAESTINCVVDPKSKPSIYEVYADQNPASTETNFYLVHDRPDRMMTVKVEVFNLLGHPVWSATSTGLSDSFLSVPINWNLTDKAGRRVQRGIYLYRATITESDGEQHITKSSRIAVTAP